ncbi:MAG: DNA gyrase subunit B [Lachnospiraceae bacterium]|nr:DNA gyrase subunit B [Lachnospiraceae bacterium]
MAREKYDASSIKVLEGLEAVRKRPGMYIGSVSTSGMNHLIYEIVDNAVDEHLAGYCTEIHVTIQDDYSVIVSDNGRGIPVGMHEKGVPAERLVFTTLHAGGKFDNNAYKTSGGLHGVGSSVVNALSEYLEVRVMTGGKIYYDAYQKGEPDMLLDENGLLPIIGTTKKTGTTITFLPDSEIFGKIKYNVPMIKSRLHETTYLNPGLRVFFNCEIKGEEEKAEFYETEGIQAYVKELNKGKAAKTEVIHYQGNSEDIEVEIAFQFVDTFEEKILGYCNNIYTSDGGTHITGFKTRFTQVINTYARELGMLKEKDNNFTGADTRCGLTAIVAIKHHDPLFEGQTKTKLGSADAARAVNNVTGEQMVLYCDKNLDTLKSMIECAMKSAKLRKEEEKAKSNLLGKQKYSFDGNGKLANCESRNAEKCEIFIVEGDSAGGSAKKARNRQYQAIMPIRGKILNVEKASIDKVLANAEIKSMVQAFGCGFSEGYGNDFDISKLRYNKIIIMADADVDGAHISTLLLTFFYRFMPELISEGHVYIAMPPLYKVIPSGNGKQEYLFDDKSLEDYRNKHKNKKFILQRYKGLGEMDADQLWETTMNPEERNLKQVNIEDGRMANEVTEVLMGSDVEPRREFIYTHAREAELDIT